MAIKNKILYIFLDIAGIIAAYFSAALARYASVSDSRLRIGTWDGSLIIVLLYLLTLMFYQPKTEIEKRSNWREFRIVCEFNMYLAFLLAVTLYLFKVNDALPRSFYLLFFVFNIFYMYLGRMYYKRFQYSYYKNRANCKKLLVYANESNMLKVMRKLQLSGLHEYEIVAAAVVEQVGRRKTDKKIEVDPVKPDSGVMSAWGNVRIYELKYGPDGTYMEDCEQSIEEYMKQNAIDDVLVSIPECSRDYLSQFILYLESMGIAVHVAVNTFGLTEREKKVEDFGVYHVLTYCPRVFEPTELFLKRLMDIAGGLVGALLTVLIGIFLVPAIYIESPGPVIFKQTRIGRNGRRFKIYKFRSMYMDAEERKKELMKQNEMNGLMFKMKDDPRITKVGKFIRKTSLDEFPQFFNVLKGDMSLVGTRPPTEDEFLQYDEHHKRRLSLKPGITGMWQVSGRSDIQDFEEVVRLDVEYIDNWSIWLDIKILIMTVLMVVRGKGAE